MQFSIVSSDSGESNVTVFLDGEIHVAHSDHPNFKAIVGTLTSGDELVSGEDLIALFDASAAVAARFERLSDRVTVAGGAVYFDGDRVDNALTQQVVRFLSADVEDWQPLVNFFEKVQQNPNEHSREQLYDWLMTHEFAITPSGDFVGYKGVSATDSGYESISSGPAIVDGVSVNGHVPNNPGSVVEMPRTKVQHDPSHGCSTGLHVGTWDYAKDFSRGTVLEVHVNPRDVVSVPTDCDHAKLRTCRYFVKQAISVPYESPLVDDDPFWDDEF